MNRPKPPTFLIPVGVDPLLWLPNQREFERCSREAEAYMDAQDAEVKRLEQAAVQYRRTIDELQGPGLGLEPSLDGHFLNHCWDDLLFVPSPVLVYRHASCPLTPGEVWQALDAWNAHCNVAIGGRLPQFFNLESWPDEPGFPYGVMLYGQDVPAGALEHWSIQSTSWFLGVRVKRYLRDRVQGRVPVFKQQRWALSNIPLSENAYGLGGLIHELGHVLGLADHYYIAGPENDGKEGLYEDSDSVMAQPGLGIRPHDIEDLTTLYQSELRYRL